jgi:hypothetical protein
MAKVVPPQLDWLDDPLRSESMTAVRVSAPFQAVLISPINFSHIKAECTSKFAHVYLRDTARIDTFCRPSYPSRTTRNHHPGGDGVSRGYLALACSSTTLTG